MPRSREAFKRTAAATAAAAALLCVWTASLAEGRGVVSHIVVGVPADSMFAVSVEGFPLPGGPFTSDEIGILTFDVDDAGLPPGPIEVSFAALPLSPTGPPIIGGVAFREVSATSVAISWTTDRAATSQVRYGTKGKFDLSTPADTSRVTEHEVLVEPVVPRTTYAFIVLSACGCDTASSAPGWFRTIGPPGLGLFAKGPTILRPGAEDVTETGAVIRWTTDRPCSTWVECGENGSFARSSQGTPVGECGYEAAFDGLEPGTEYTFRVCAVGASGGYTESPPHSFVTLPAGGEGEADAGQVAAPDVDANAEPGLAGTLSLSVMPNPAADAALLSFSLPERGRVRASVFSGAGRLVRVLADREYAAGPHAVAWDLRSGDGRPASSGAYLCALETPAAVVTRKLVVVR